MATTGEVADRLIDCQDHARTLPPISAGDPTFDVGRAYEVLAAITERRKAQGWRPVGRKIGFTNRTIWPRYGVYQPLAPIDALQLCGGSHAKFLRSRGKDSPRDRRRKEHREGDCPAPCRIGRAGSRLGHK